MAGHSADGDRRTGGSIPGRLIWAAVGVLCAGLLSSALFTFGTLSRLRIDYLSNRGHAIAAALEAQARGPGRRNNPAFWQSLFEANYETYFDTVAYLAIVDQDGRILASKEKASARSLEAAGQEEQGIYDFEEALARPRNPRGEANPAVANWRIRIGLYSSDADFIRRQAYVQLALSCAAIVGLCLMTAYLLHMLNRFVVLQARAGAEAQLKSLGVMAASLAHEIRNPLGAIKGLTQLAQEDLAPDHAAQVQLDTVVNEAERLERLVTDLLDFARPKESQVIRIDLTHLMTDVENVLQSKLDAAGVTLRFSSDPAPLTVKSDPGGLRQVLFNILINAIDASPAGSEVVLRAFGDVNARSIVIQVDDNGKGVGEGDPEALFQPFVTTKTRGTGLGLAISRQIVERLGGSLTLGNNPQGGARCSIRLPLGNKGD